MPWRKCTVLVQVSPSFFQETSVLFRAPAQMRVGGQNGGNVTATVLQGERAGVSLFSQVCDPRHDFVTETIQISTALIIHYAHLNFIF